MKKFGILVAGVVCGICWLSGHSAWGQARIDQQITRKPLNLTETEDYILQRTVSGERADLLKRFGPDEKKRRVRGEFLKALLTSQFSGFTVHYHGVQISNAIIPDRLDLENAEVPFAVSLLKCVFQGNVNCQDAVFKKNLELNQSEFWQDAYFLKTKVNIGAYFRDCIFHSLVNFNGADIGAALTMEGSRFECPDKIYFNACKVGTGAFFNKVIFRGQVLFNKSKVGDLQMARTDFCQEADFRGLKVVYDAIFSGARFYNGAQFAGASIGGDLQAHGVQFLSADKFASLCGLKVGHDANFAPNKNFPEPAIFNGPVDFDNAEIPCNFLLEQAEFRDDIFGVEAIALKVGSVASCKEAKFHGPVSFSGSTMGGQLNAEGAQFLSEAEVDLSGLNVGQLAKFTGAVFKGDVSFSGARIGGELQRNFEHGTKLADIVMHNRRISLKDAHLTDLTIMGPDQARLDIQELNLERAVINRCLDLANIDLQNLKGWNLQSKGQAIFKNVKIKSTADLRDSNFLSLKLFNVSWPRPGKTKLAGLTYQAISAVEIPASDKDWEPVRKWITGSRFDKRNYLQFEAYLKHCGYEGLADKVYIEMKRRELKRSWSWDFWNWPYNFLRKVLVDWGVGYGRDPLRAFYYSLALVLFGMTIFSQPGVLTWDQEKENGGRLSYYRAFWYSFDLFIPFLSFGPDKTYQVQPEAEVQWAGLVPGPLRALLPQRLQAWLENHHFSVQIYSYIHQICGYIMIPIGLAAVTGLIR